MIRSLSINVLFLFNVTVQAAVPNSTSKNYDISHSAQDYQDIRFQPYSQLQVNGNFKIWYLMGEPIISCDALWKNPGITQIVMEDGTRVLSEPGEEHLWNLMLVAQFPNSNKNARRLHNGGGSHFNVFCDAGVVAQDGRDGFNVAGSPAWDRFICSTPNKVDTRYSYNVNLSEDDHCKAIGGEWLPSSSAKHFVINNDINIQDIMITSFELNNGDTLRRAEKMLWRKKSFAHKKAKANDLKNKLKNINHAMGVDADRRINTALLHVESYPSYEKLKQLDEVIETLDTKLPSNSFNSNWRERDRKLVANQLKKIELINKKIEARNSEQSKYFSALQSAQRDFFNNIKYDSSSLEPHSQNGMVGYRIKNTDIWIISPQFQTGSYFNQEGYADVVFDDVIARREPYTTEREICGEKKMVNKERIIRRRTVGVINIEGKTIEGPKTEEYEEPSFGPFLVSCPIR